MRYLLDTDVVSDLYDKSAASYPEISARLAALSDEDEVFISILTLYELEYGYANAPSEKRSLVQRKIIEARIDFEILPLTTRGARTFGQLKKQLREQRALTKESIKRHNVDLILASSALEADCVLVSSDRLYRDLATFVGTLQIEDWTA